ncbi:MAG: hypothetical protein K0B10_13005 [Vicingaceae bacterium]|nr:hypothetical protein [Vicingaceae bacterium]
MLWKQKIVLICCAVMQLSQQTLVSKLIEGFDSWSTLDKVKFCVGILGVGIGIYQIVKK